MATTFKEVRKLQSERVRMQFDDGREVELHSDRKSTRLNSSH